ncbi:MAG: HYR domain-containing protein, partial [Bacteroidia bacterium]|nr:HYR domain-containing protein [Bacteroidia bacterium]
MVSQNGCTATSSAVTIVSDAIPPVAACKNINLTLNASGTATIVVPATTQSLFFEDWTGDNAPYYSTTNSNFANNTLNWNLLSGDIDRANFVSGIAGSEIDLSGFANGVIETKQTFNFTPGSYTFSFQQIANSLGGNGVQVDIGTLLNQTFITSLSITSESATFTVTSNTSAKVGSFIGQIRLVRNVASTLAIENGSTDNCSIASITASKTNFDCTNIGANTVTLTVTDVNGNIGTCQSTVTVIDDILPVIASCPTNITLNATSAAGAVVTYATPTATDVCGATVTLTGGLASGSTFPLGTTTVTHTATDPS